MDGLQALLAVTVVAALAPLIVAALPGPRIPQVVVLILAGVLIGPHVLGLADTGSIKLLANIGLGFLFLLAGSARACCRCSSTRRSRPRWPGAGVLPLVHQLLPRPSRAGPTGTEW
jgi:Kef-type K+ transport system membrane component KefB